MSLHLATAEVFPMTNDILVPYERAEPEPSRRDLEWRTRYDGIVAVAHIGDKAVAGISGPWSGKYALTWWERPLPARQLELFDTLDDAKREVEEWATRMSSGLPASVAPLKTVVAPASTPRPLPSVAAKGSLINHVRSFLPEFGRKRTQADVARQRQQHAQDDTDLGDLHFAAND
ncbi:MAG: hypothetical protein ABW187_08710 [Dokdonella sp.]